MDNQGCRATVHIDGDPVEKPDALIAEIEAAYGEQDALEEEYETYQLI